MQNFNIRQRSRLRAMLHHAWTLASSSHAAQLAQSARAIVLTSSAAFVLWLFSSSPVSARACQSAS